MARAAAALVKHEALPTDILAEGLQAQDLSPTRFPAADDYFARQLDLSVKRK
jgi:hypothetical protein